MKAEVVNTKTTKIQKYPYLGRMENGYLVLVGRYSTIIITPESENGNGYRHNEEGPSFSVTPLSNLEQVILQNE